MLKGDNNTNNLFAYIFIPILRGCAININLNTTTFTPNIIITEYFTDEDN